MLVSVMVEKSWIATRILNEAVQRMAFSCELSTSSYGQHMIKDIN